MAAAAFLGGQSRLRFLAFACLAAAASAATRPDVLADLADRARAQPAEFAADALLRIAAAPRATNIAWKRQVIEDAFHLAAGAQQLFPRHNWTGKPAGLFDKAYIQGLDACTLECRAVDAMLALDYKKARELFASIPPPHLPQLACDDALVYDVSIFYETAGEIAARGFSSKEVADEEPFHFLERYAANLTSPVQAAPIARMLAGALLKPGQFETLVDSFAAGLKQLSGDERSFAATVAGESDGAAIAALAAECTRRRLNAQPLLEAWRAYLVRNLKGARCADLRLDAAPGVPQGISTDDLRPSSVDGKAAAMSQCESSECRQLAAQFSALVMGTGNNGYALTTEQKATAEWDGKLREYLAALADWTGGDDPSECFQYKSRFYDVLFNAAPNDPDRDLLLSTLLDWLQQNGYQRDHRVEWFYAVNTLIIHAFADPLAMKGTVRALRESPDPVISLYAQLEQLLPRPMQQMLGLL